MANPNQLNLFDVWVDMPTAMTDTQVVGAMAFAIKQACVANGYPAECLNVIASHHPTSSVANPQEVGYQLTRHTIKVRLPITLNSPEGFLAGALATNFFLAGQPGNVSVTLSNQLPDSAITGPTPPIDIMTSYPRIKLACAYSGGTNLGTLMVSVKTGSNVSISLNGAQSMGQITPIASAAIS